MRKYVNDAVIYMQIYLVEFDEFEWIEHIHGQSVQKKHITHK